MPNSGLQTNNSFMSSFQNLSGRVLTVPKFLAATQTKKAWSKFRLQVGENIYEVVCFDAAARVVADKITVVGEQVTVAGKFDAKGQFRFIADTVIAGGKALGKQMEVEDSTDRQRIRESAEALRKEYKLVMVERDNNEKQLLPTSEVVWVKGRPLAKIDFLMDYYGAREVRGAISMIFGGGLPRVGDDSEKFRRYREWRNQMVQGALKEMGCDDIRNRTKPSGGKGANDGGREEISLPVPQTANELAH